MARRMKIHGLMLTKFDLEAEHFLHWMQFIEYCWNHLDYLLNLMRHSVFERKGLCFEDC